MSKMTNLSIAALLGLLALCAGQQFEEGREPTHLLDLLRRNAMMERDEPPPVWDSEEEDAPVSRVRRQSSVNTGPGDDYNRLGTLYDDNGNSHSLLGHYNNSAQTAGLGYEYGFNDGDSSLGLGISNNQFRVGGAHSWTTGNGWQHSLGGSFGTGRGGQTAGISYRLRFRRALRAARELRRERDFRRMRDNGGNEIYV